MHAIRRGPEKHYRSVSDLFTNFGHLEEIKPEPYQQDEHSLSRSRRIVLTATLIIIAILLAIIAFEIIA